VVAALACAPRAFAQDAWKVNEKEYLEKPGANLLVFSNEYNGMFFDEKTSGIDLILHEVRIATGGAVRLKPAPEQWDAIPKMTGRKVDKAANTIEVTLRYDAYDFDSRVVVTPQGAGVSIAVFVDKPIPAALEGRAGLNMEFLPSKFFSRTYMVDGKPAIFPRQPYGPSEVKPADTQIRQFEGYSTFDDWGRKEYVEPKPFAVGKTFVLAPEDPERRVTIKAIVGDLQFVDGRNVAQNGWFVARSLLQAKATGKVAEWYLEPHTIPGWKRAAVIGYSQAGYHPSEKKVTVIELDPRDAPQAVAKLFEVKPDGTTAERASAKVVPWGPYLRYSYVTADFSAVKEPGLYYIQYGAQKTGVFPIGPQVYADIWHLTQDVWFPVQMDHMRVNEAYRLWHAVPHRDDARQAPLNFQHFDNYRMGATTETKFKPGEHIPGLDVGGWFDAGDFDIETSHQSGVITAMVDTWERFKPMRDETLVDQATRFVDIHRPDGKPDLLQQIEHGALMLAAMHRVFGRGIRGITDPLLYTYTHLGDGSNQTDNLIYDPSLKLHEVSADNRRSGVPDDRWAFTAPMPAVNYGTIGALAAASRALRGFNDTFAEECLTLAKTSYARERKVQETAKLTENEARFLPMSELQAVSQLFVATKDTQYLDRLNELLWPLLDRVPAAGMGLAARLVPHLDAAYKAKLQPYAAKYRASIDELEKQNPYGVPVSMGGWAGSTGVSTWGGTNYHLHKAYPDLFGPELVSRAAQYLFGRHPASNVSFVSGVGVHSKTVTYGSTRADFSFIPGGVVPGVLVIKPDFPEHMEDWPFLWGENEVVIDGVAQYLFLAHAVGDVLK
jgi:hypothetical protein